MFKDICKWDLLPLWSRVFGGSAALILPSQTVEITIIRREIYHVMRVILASFMTPTSQPNRDFSLIALLCPDLVKLKGSK